MAIRGHVTITASHFNLMLFSRRGALSGIHRDQPASRLPQVASLAISAARRARAGACACRWRRVRIRVPTFSTTASMLGTAPAAALVLQRKAGITSSANNCMERSARSSARLPNQKLALK